jgi:hypothetical protein
MKAKLYGFDSGKVRNFSWWEMSDDGSERSIKGVYEKRRLRQLEDLMRKIPENRSKYRELNNGRPFLPTGS